MRTTRKRVALPFLFRADDCRGANGKLIARSYGTEVEAVFTRASRKLVRDANGVLAMLPHSGRPLGVASGDAALVLDPAAPTNLAANASDFSNASWTKTNVTVSANSTVAPDGATTADTLTTGTAFGGNVVGTVTFTGNGTKYAVCYLMASGAAPTVDIGIYDFTATAYRHQVRVTWATLSAATVNGTGVITFARVAGTAWYRLEFTVPSVVAANTNQFIVVLPAASPTAAVIAWQAFASDTVPGSGLEVGRAGDACYFPFTLAPTALTVYARFVERGTIAMPASARVVNIGVDSVPRFYLSQLSGSGLYSASHQNAASTTVTSTMGAAPVVGDVVELRATLTAAGVVQLHQSINGAAETSASATAANTLYTIAWELPRLYLNSAGGNVGCNDFTHVAVSLGSLTRTELRDLAEVY